MVFRSGACCQPRSARCALAHRCIYSGKGVNAFKEHEHEKQHHTGGPEMTYSNRFGVYPVRFFGRLILTSRWSESRLKSLTWLAWNRVCKVYGAPQILDRFLVNLNWCRRGEKLYFSPFLPPLYTTPQASDSLTTGASDPGCKTGNTHAIH